MYLVLRKMEEYEDRRKQRYLLLNNVLKFGQDFFMKLLSIYKYVKPWGST